MESFYERNKKIILVLLAILTPTVIVAIVLAIKYIRKKRMTPEQAIEANKASGTKGGVNNPGNIRTSSIAWKGKITLPGQTFESFDTIENGILAMYKNLEAYRNKYGLNTITEILNRWAPPSDGNDTSAYIKYVAGRLGVDPNSPLSTDRYPELIAAMSKMEGTYPVDAGVVKTALNLA